MILNKIISKVGSSNGDPVVLLGYSRCLRFKRNSGFEKVTISANYSSEVSNYYSGEAYRTDVVVKQYLGGDASTPAYICEDEFGTYVPMKDIPENTSSLPAYDSTISLYSGGYRVRNPTTATRGGTIFPDNHTLYTRYGIEDVVYSTKPVHLKFTCRPIAYSRNRNTSNGETTSIVHKSGYYYYYYMATASGWSGDRPIIEFDLDGYEVTNFTFTSPRGYTYMGSSGSPSDMYARWESVEVTPL